MKLPRQVEEATRRATAHHSREDRERAVRKAVQDVVFMFELHRQANEAIVIQQRAHRLVVAYLGALLYLRAVAPLGGRNKARRAEEVAAWKILMERTLEELYRLEDGLQLASEQYFEGNDPLYVDSRVHVEDTILELEHLVAVHNRSVVFAAEERRRKKRTTKGRATKVRRPRTVIDLQAIRKVAKAAAAPEMMSWVNGAKARTLRMMGDHEGANRALDALGSAIIGGAGIHAD